jgi:hypothetical protein
MGDKEEADAEVNEVRGRGRGRGRPESEVMPASMTDDGWLNRWGYR